MAASHTGFANFLGQAHRNRFDFAYGSNYRENSLIDGLSLRNPFPRGRRLKQVWDLHAGCP